MANISKGPKPLVEIENILKQHHITSVTANQVENAVSFLQGNTNLKDFYSIGLWGYCDGDIVNGNYETSWCSKPRSEYYFNATQVWGMDNNPIMNSLPNDYHKAMDIYKGASKWMFIAYWVAFAVTCLVLVVGVFAICSRWGSCVTTLVALASFGFTTAASVTSTVLFSIMEGTAGTALAAYNIKFSLGKNMFVATWLAVAFSLGALLFWSFSACCCSGRSSYNRNDPDRRSGAFVPEKAPYTYEPLAGRSAPNTSYNHQVEEYPMTTPSHGGNAYEPYRNV